MNRLPQRLRLGFSSASADDPSPATETGLVDFVAYGEDCILSGRAVLDADRLSDNAQRSRRIPAVGAVGRSLRRRDPVPARRRDRDPEGEIYLVHASGPRGDAARRHRTTPQHLAIKVGPYKVRGFFHSLPGADPVVAFRRRKAMVPLTDARIEFTLHGLRRETRVDALIVNREQIDWVQVMQSTQVEFPERARAMVSETA